MLWNFFPTKNVYSTAAIKENCYIQAFPSLCFRSDSNNVNIIISEPPLWLSIPLTHRLRLHIRCLTLSCVDLCESQGTHGSRVGVRVHQCVRIT